MSKIVFFALLALLPACFATYDLFTAASRFANGNVVSLAQPLNPQNYSGFEGDPSFNISIWSTIADDGYLVEQITSLGTHTGTHLSAPCHFIEGAKCVDELPASAFVFLAALIDVSARVANRPNQADFQLEWSDILRFESTNGPIPRGAIVLLYTGFGPKFGTPSYANDKFPGFSADAVDKMYRWRKIKGLGSDTFGPDASSDTEFGASYTSYANGGITIENMANLHLLRNKRWGSLIVATPAKLKNGSGFQTNVLAFL